MSVKTLVAALGVIFVLALVPPAAATWEHRRRIARASSEAAAIADHLRGCARDPRVATGPGHLPITPGGGSIQNVTVTGEVCGWALRPDPWGNGYLIGPPGSCRRAPTGLSRRRFRRSPE